MLKKTVLVLVIFAGLFYVCYAGSENKVEVTVEKLPSKVVVYTIYRGSYDKAFTKIGGLYGIAGKNNIMDRGSMSYVYLNCDSYISSEHLLTEIQVPVKEGGLKLCGTLGEMTDVKRVNEMTVLKAIKPSGAASPKKIIESLYSFSHENGYAVKDNLFEVFLENMQTGDYTQMKTAFMLPVEKLK